jgi:pimeloyl-ACP methyl ester carboxylesterase
MTTKHRGRLLTALSLATALTACSAPDHEVTEPVAKSGGPAQAQLPHTVVFIHGMFMTPDSWADWRRYFEAKGYKTYAPAWPQHDMPASAMREKFPNDALSALTLPEVVDTYRKFIATLPEKPILVGHSMGGLVVQLLLADGLGAAGIAVDSAPPKGVLSFRWSFLRSNWPVVSPFADEKEAVLLDEAQFAYAFTNCVDEAKQPAIYQKFAAPESRQVGKGSLSDAAVIDFAKKTRPLLIIAGGEDHIIPASLNYSNFEEYSEAPSLTEFKLFPERCHYTVGQDGWQAVADYSLGWLARVGKS